MSKIKDKERILKAARKKYLLKYKESLMKVSDFSAEYLHCTPGKKKKKDGMIYSKSWKKTTAKHEYFTR